MQPRLSVVVPFRNAGPRLTACLESLAEQTLSCFEAVLVDDGSRDGSSGIARDFAAGDRRFRHVRLGSAGHGRTAGFGAGLSAARNRGVREIPRTVDFLAFADADDVVPPDAYARLTASLDTTGSAFATGNVWQLGPEGRTQDPAYGRLTESGTRTRTHITRDPRLLDDGNARNKVFRRAFWDRHALAFPERRQYAAARVMLPAHFLAGTVDVLADHVSYQRLRGGADALADTHARLPAPGTDVKAARDRVAACDHVSRFLALQYPAHKAAYDARCLRTDLLPYLLALPAGGPGYRDRFLADAADFTARVPSAALDSLPPPLRRAWRLVRDGRPADLLALLAEAAADAAAAPAATGTNAAPAATGTGTAAASLSTAASAAAEPLLTGVQAVARVRELGWDPAGALRVTGYAYVPGTPADRPNRPLTVGVLRPEPPSAAATGSRTGRSRAGYPRLLTARSIPDPGATAESAQHEHAYDHAGFEITVPPAKLRPRRDGLRRGSQRHGAEPGGAGAGPGPHAWLLSVLLTAPGTLRHTPVYALEGAADRYLVRDLNEGADGAAGPGGRRRLEAGFDAAGRLRLCLTEQPVRIESHRREGTDLVLGGRLYGAAVRTERTAEDTAPGRDGEAAVPTALRLCRPDDAAAPGTGTLVIEVPLVRPGGHRGVRPPDGDRFDAHVPLPQLTDAPAAAHRVPVEVPPPYTERWRADLVMPDGTLTPAPAALTLPPVRYALHDGRELCATADDHGLLRIEITRRPIAASVTWTDDGTLTVSGTAGSAPGTARAAGPGHPAVSGTSDGPGELVLRHAALGEEVTVPMERGDGTAFSVSLHPGGGTLRAGRWYARVRTAAGAHGPAREVPLRALAPLTAELPVHHTADGRRFTVDLHDGDHLCVVAGTVLPPEDHGPYRRHRLRTATYPAHRAEPLREAVLYTADHGTDALRAVHEELVRRGADTEHLWVTRDRRTPVPELAHPVEEHSAAWYEALARCRRVVAAGHLPEFFRRRADQTVVQLWHGTPLRRLGTDLTGTRYAHHAHLESLPQRAAQWSVLTGTHRLSRTLAYDGELLQSGSPANDLLFSPDRDKTADRVRTELHIPEDARVILYAPALREYAPYAPPPLDLHEVSGAFDSALAGHVLLVRRHPWATGPLPGGSAPHVQDVSGHPSATELLATADVLVTDYSSLMFDYAHTARPLLFLTPDLAHYADPSVRGFTFDFARRAPGPLLNGTTELLTALADLDSVTARHADAYAAFRRRHCDLDDGRAAQRVAERLLR